jgi:hypothetical protein
MRREYFKEKKEVTEQKCCCEVRCGKVSITMQSLDLRNFRSAD